MILSHARAGSGLHERFHLDVAAISKKIQESLFTVLHECRKLLVDGTHRNWPTWNKVIVQRFSSLITGGQPTHQIHVLALSKPLVSKLLNADAPMTLMTHVCGGSAPTVCNGVHMFITPATTISIVKCHQIPTVVGDSATFRASNWPGSQPPRPWIPFCSLFWAFIPHSKRYHDVSWGLTGPHISQLLYTKPRIPHIFGGDLPIISYQIAPIMWSRNS